MIIAALDLETTGLKVEKGDRIIEVCIGLYELDADGVIKPLRLYEARVNPMRTISVEAQRVHGISLEDLREMPVWSEIAQDVKKILEAADVVVIHNAEFDAPFIEAEQRNTEYPLDKPLQTFCTMDNARWATFDGKRPNLGELCWSLNVEYDASKAHAASYDVAKMMECFSKGLRLGLYQLGKGD